jgi:hypothetical protein
MAITKPHFENLRHLASTGEVPRGCRILEIGEANLYGDISPAMLYVAAAELAADESREAIVKKLQALEAIIPQDDPYLLFKYAKLVYEILFDTTAVDSIDLHGTPAAMRLDLNLIIPGSMRRKYEVVINHGTAEHVFHIGRVFETMHECCEMGGLMIHDAPCTGWFDHGFYGLNPTLFYDLAAANHYAIRRLALTQINPPKVTPLENRGHAQALAFAKQIPENSCLFVALRKTSDEPFQIPMQGYYDNRLTAQERQAWYALR